MQCLPISVLTNPPYTHYVLLFPSLPFSPNSWKKCYGEVVTSVACTGQSFFFCWHLSVANAEWKFHTSVTAFGKPMIIFSQNNHLPKLKCFLVIVIFTSYGHLEIHLLCKSWYCSSILYNFDGAQLLFSAVHLVL